MKSLSKSSLSHQHGKLPQESGRRHNDRRSLAFSLGASFILAASLFAAMPVDGQAREKQAAKSTAKDVSEKKGDLKALRGQIESLRKDVAVAEGKRSDAADQLKEIEQDISRTQRDLQRLSDQRDRLQDALRALNAQAHELESKLNGQQAQLEKLVYRQYLQGNPDSLRLLLNGDNPSQIARDLYYLKTIGLARSQLLREIDGTLERKQALAANTRERAEEMAAVEASQKEQRDKLVAQRAQRQQVLDRISAKITQQRREIGNLQRDEKQLSQLIDRLAKAIAARAAAKREVPPKRATPSPTSPSTSPKGQTAQTPATELRNESVPEAAPAGSFAAQKGQLRLPTRGVVSNRFGTARQEGSTWKGLFIRAGSGSEVKAIAAGRVVFADWMRGFGNLVIVDHGSNYLSIYGNNEAVLKQTGDSVKSGDTIASVGNSGGNPESGLYFELRYQGQPIDPLKWVSLK